MPHRNMNANKDLKPNNTPLSTPPPLWLSKQNNSTPLRLNTPLVLMKQNISPPIPNLEYPPPPPVPFVHKVR